MEIHSPARSHGISDAAIRHVLEHAITVVDLEPDADPPKALAIGPDPAGNLLEIIWLELDEVNLVIRAMPLRPQFYDLLPQSPEDLSCPTRKNTELALAAPSPTMTSMPSHAR